MTLQILFQGKIDHQNEALNDSSPFLILFSRASKHWNKIIDIPLLILKLTFYNYWWKGILLNIYHYLIKAIDAMNMTKDKMAHVILVALMKHVRLWNDHDIDIRHSIVMQHSNQAWNQKIFESQLYKDFFEFSST